MKSVATHVNPFPGLRPFRSDEHHLFFGREEQTAALLQLLRTNRFLAVVGTSGSGKSSLVRAGMIAELHGGTMTHAGSTWEVMILRPGGSPIENLARAFVEADLYDPEDPSTLPRLLATLRRSRFGLVEAMKQSEVFEPGTNLLVVVDQFEELFRFRQLGVESEEAATAFVNLLLTASEQAECPIYVAITMRSDYLGDCSEIPGLAEAVNDGEYLIPRLMRDQKRDAIEKPIGVGGAKISPLLVQRLLNDVGDDPDQLPVLQHALMRMWEVWSDGSDHNRPLSLSDFEATGGLASALSNHADEIYDSLPTDAHRAACEKIFKTLTEKGEDNRGIRRPTRLSKLQAIAGVDRECITTVLDAFRNSGVTFLMPGNDVELNDRTVIDLSHESLMRGWQRLRSWVEEEAQSARIFRRVLDTARLRNDGKAGLFRDPDLQIALSWREEEQPNAHWAEQYGGDFETAIGFLDASHAEVESERQAKELARQRELEQAQRLAEAERQRATDQARAAVRLRWMVRGLGLVAMVAIMATVFAWLARQEARRNADTAAEKAADADEQKQIAQSLLIDVAAAKEVADANLKTAEAAEQRSREFRYATDVQLAATLVADKTANASQIYARLSDHDPESNQELKGKEDLRGFEWHYLKRMVEDRAKVFDGFEKEVVAVALNTQGELVTLDSDARLQHFNRATRQETRPALDLKKGRNVSSTALSPDGRRVALAIGDKVHLVEVMTGVEAARPIPVRTRKGLMFSTDGNMVITVDTGLGWWDSATGNPIAVDDFQLTVFDQFSVPVSVSGDGLTVAVGGEGTNRGSFSVFRMDPPTRGITRLLDKVGDQGTKRALAISPDGQTVAVSYYFQGAISLFDTSSGKRLLQNAAAHPASVSAIAFSPDSMQLVTAALDGSIKLWKDYRVLDSSESTAFVGHTQQVDTLTCVEAGKQVFSAGKDKSVRLWNLDQDAGTLHRTIADAAGFRARYSPDGILMAVSGEKDAIPLRDGLTGELVASLPREASEMGSNSVAFSPANRMLAVGFGGKKDLSLIELWDIDLRERLAVMPGSTDIPGFTTDENSGIVSGLAFSPDGKHLVAGFGSLSLLTRGEIGNHPLLVYDVANRRVVRRLEGPKNYCISVAFSPDGSRLAAACYDGTARIWDTASWREIHVLGNPDTASESGNRRVLDVAFSPDGKLLAMASAEKNVILWNAETGTLVKTLSGHASEVSSVAFSPDGRTLASGSLDGTVRLWNTATWRELIRLESGTRFSLSPKSLSFSPDGSRLLAASGAYGVLQWSIRPADNSSESMEKSFAESLRSGINIENRVRMLSEHPRLHETLATLASRMPNDQVAVAAIAATAANRHASLRQWESAVKQYDRLKQLDPKASDTLLRIPGLLRVATALLHQDRPADAASMLAGGEKRRAQDGNANRVVRLGIQYTGGKFPLTLTKVDRGSPAWQAGMRPGDLLLKFNEVEFNTKTLADFQALMGKGAGTEVQLTIQHPGLAESVTVQPTVASYILDDFSVQMIESLRALIEHKLAESANDPGLLELRAELAGQSSDYEKQVADYTAAIAALSERPAAEAAADLARLHRRRGNAYVGLKQWQPAFDDYAKGITAETMDEELLANRARAQAGSTLARHWMAFQPLELKSFGGSTLTKQDDNSILVSGTNPGVEVYTLVARPGLNRINRIILEALPDPSLPNNGPGRVLSNGNFYLFEIRVFSGGVLVPLTDIVAEHMKSQMDPHKAIDGDVNTGAWTADGREGKKSIALITTQLERATDDELKIELHFAAGHNLGRFRATLTDMDVSLEDAVALLPLESPSDALTLLSRVHRARNDQTSVNQLVVQHPRSAGTVGDLFLASNVKDWLRAVEIYSLGITPETTDAELLGKRAKAYEELKDWSAAAADWSRAAKENPAGAKLLTDFADRLLKAEQNALATAQRQRARTILEGMLQADPGDDPAIDALAALLLDMSESAKWTTLKPSELKPSSGATLVPHDDNSVVLEQRPYTLKLTEPGNALQAIRIETSPDNTFPATNAAPFTEYQILSTDLPERGFRGRYVRIDLPGDNSQFPREESIDGAKKMLNIAEVQVFQGNSNIAFEKQARQSSTMGSDEAKRAVDGNTDGTPGGRSYAHTNPDTDGNDPWWEVDLVTPQNIDRILVWNRTDDRWGNRLKHFRVRILDATRNVVFEQVIDAAPNPSTEITRQVELAKVEPDVAGGDVHWQLSFESQREQNPWRRLRISMTDEQSTIAVDAIGTPNVNWTVSKPFNVVLPAETPLIAQEDGSWIVGASEDSLSLPVLAAEVKAIRVETASGTEANETGSSAFKDYRVEAINAPRSESGGLQGRYVRLDLPGDNSQFPRMKVEGAVKCINLAELQVLSGEENVALGKMARQSSDFLNFKAALAVDGDTAGMYPSKPFAHTTLNDADPWWELDLGGEQTIDRMVVWTRTDTDADYYNRMNHFRIRVLDADRNVVLEQVIDHAPQPSREIDCRGLLVAKTLDANADAPQWILRLSQDSGVDLGRRFRISSTQGLSSLAREEAIAEARKIPQPVARLAAAYDLNGTSSPSADWFRRALDDTDKNSEQRRLLLALLEDHPQPLAELLKQQPDDIELQLALARSQLKEGQKLLSRKQAEVALPKLLQAQEVISKLRAEHPEPKWTVLTPTDAVSKGGATLTVQNDGSILASGKNPELDSYTLTTDVPVNSISALKIEAIPDPSMMGGGVGRGGSGSVALSRVSLKLLQDDQPDRSTANFDRAIADIGDAKNVIDHNDNSTWAVYPDYGKPHQLALRLSEPLSLRNPARVVIGLEFFSQQYKTHGLGRFRLSVTSEPMDARGFQLLDLRDAELATLDVAIGMALAQQDKPSEAAAAFARALDRVEDDEARKPLIAQVAQHQAALSLLAERRPQDDALQLAMATSLAASGNKALTENRQDQALLELGRARELFAKLAAQNPETQWTVLEPAEIRSAGGARWRVQDDGSILEEHNSGDETADQLTITADCTLDKVQAIRLEILPLDASPGRAPGAIPVGRQQIADLRAFVRNKQGSELQSLEFTEATTVSDSSASQKPRQFGKSTTLGGLSTIFFENRLDTKVVGYWRNFEGNLQEYFRLLPGKSYTESTYEGHVWVIKRELDGEVIAEFVSDGQQMNAVIEDSPGDSISRVFVLGTALAMDATREFVIELNQQAPQSLDRFRISVTDDPKTNVVAQFQQELKASGLADLQMSLANAYGRQAQVDDSATAFSEALDLATDRDAKTKILQAASAYDGVLNKLGELRSQDATFFDVLARYQQSSGDFATARTMAATARTLYEQQLAVQPSNTQLAKNLGDLMFEVHPVEWTVLSPLDLRSEGNAIFTPQQDGSVLVSGPHVAGDVYTVTVKSDVDVVGAVRLEVLPDESLPVNGPGRHESGNFQLQSLKLCTPSVDGIEQSPVAMSGVTASFAYSANDADVAGTIDDTLNKVWHIWGQTGKQHHADFVLSSPLHIEPGTPLTIVLKHKDAHNGINLGRFRLSVSSGFLTPEFRKSLDVAAKITAIWSRLGAAYHVHGEFDKAVDIFTRSIELAGADEAKAAAAQEAAAFPDIFAKLQERFPNNKALLLGQAKYLAAQHIAEGRFRAAADGLSGILADESDDIELLNQRASAFMKLADWKSADADYSRIIELETDDSRRRAAERTRAECLLRMGRFQAAADALLQEMMLSPAEWERMRDAYNAALLAGNPSVARMVANRFYRTVSGKQDLDAYWSGELVRLHTAIPGLVTKENQQRLLEAAAKSGGDWATAYAAAIHYRLGDLEQAQALLDTPIQDREFQALAAMLLYDRGETTRAAEFLQRAEMWFQQQLVKEPQSVIPSQVDWNVWAHSRTVWREAARKLIEPRITELDELLAKEPDRSAELLERARLLTNVGLVEEALRDLQSLVAQNVTSPESSALQGRILAGLGRDEEAMPYLNQAIDSGSLDSDVYAARGTLLLKQQQSNSARVDLEKSLELHPDALAAQSLADLLLSEAEKATEWTVLKPTEMKSEGGATLTLQADGSILASGKNPDQDAYQITANMAPQHIKAIRLEAIPDASLPGNGPGRWPGHGNFHLNEFRVFINGTPHQLEGIVVSFSSTTEEQYRNIIDGTVDGNLWSIHPKTGQRHSAIFATDLELGPDDELTFELISSRWQFPQHNLGRFRLSVSDDPKIFNREQQRFAAMRITDPWARLVAAYSLMNDQQSLDKLIQAVPSVEAGIAELYLTLKEWDRAIAAYSKRINDQTTDASLFVKRGEVYFASKQLDLARADWRRAVALKPELAQLQFDRLRLASRWSEAAEFGLLLIEQKPQDSLLWVHVPPVAVQAEHDTIYPEVCRAILELYRKAPTPENFDRAFKACLLKPGAIDMSELPLNLLPTSLDMATVSSWMPSFFWSTRALLAYRSGDAELAVKNANQSEQHAPNDHCHALNLAVLAMAQHDLKQPEKARTALNEGQQLLTKLQAGDRYLHDTLIAEILLREAEALIDGKE